MRSRQRPELLADRAYVAVRDRILTLDLVPGSAIDEVVLTDELGVGRTPIREAIKRLAHEDLVVVYPRRGTFVADINMTDLGHISELRRHLESFAAYKAALAAPADREQVSELLLELDNANREAFDTAALMQLDRRVHHLIYELSQNPFLARAARQHYNLAVRIWHLFLNRIPHLADTVLEHHDLLEAVREGDAETARSLADAHIARFADTIRGAV
jgi:DNA-binding GntR family transcriptional regulator